LKIGGFVVKLWWFEVVRVVKGGGGRLLEFVRVVEVVEGRLLWWRSGGGNVGYGGSYGGEEKRAT
jgi:hypothetical protein